MCTLFWIMIICTHCICWLYLAVAQWNILCGVWLCQAESQYSWNIEKLRIGWRGRGVAGPHQVCYRWSVGMEEGRRCVCVCARVTRHTRTRNTNDEICMKLTFVPSQNHGICIARLEPHANPSPWTSCLPAATMTSYCCCCCYCNCCFGVM